MNTLTKIFGNLVPMFFVSEGGVSISEVARIQAEHKQQNDGFWSKVADAVSGVFYKAISFVGAGDSTPRDIPGATITADEIGLYAGVAERNAETAVLMHAVKLYKRLMEQLQRMDLRLHVVEILPAAPEQPASAKLGSTCETERFMDLGNIDEMIANLNSEVLAQFDFPFFRKANELNARAAALGKLLSEQGSFFRRLVGSLPQGSEQSTQNGVVITTWKRSYNPEAVAELSRLRDQLQTEYNNLQQQLNGCKRQIKDAVRAYNLEQERRYQSAYGAYEVAARQHNLEVERIRSSAETFRQQALQELAALRVRTE